MEWLSNHKRVWAVYFSATGTTKKVVTTIARALQNCELLRLPCISSICQRSRRNVENEVFCNPVIVDFTTPSAREESLEFSKEDIVVFGVPVYAGRLPNLMLNYIKTVNGNGALAVVVVVFGNRAFDDALIELRDILEARGFHTIAAGAFVGEHSFSNKIAAGRPNEDDLRFARDFGVKVMNRIKERVVERIEVPGSPLPYRGYYQPKDILGESIDIRKVKPQTRDLCDKCGICVGLCPMGAIDSRDPRLVSGICIKCCACVKKCPKKAKHFIDSGYLYHVEDLVEKLSSINSENEVFL